MSTLTSIQNEWTLDIFALQKQMYPILKISMNRDLPLVSGNANANALVDSHVHIIIGVEEQDHLKIVL